MEGDFHEVEGVLCEASHRFCHCYASCTDYFIGKLISAASFLTNTKPLSEIKIIPEGVFGLF